MSSPGAPSIVVLNGEQCWEPFLPGTTLLYRRVQDCGWALKDGALWCIDRQGGVKVDGLLWRVGAIRPDWRQRAALQLIRLSGVPCVNAASVLLRCFDRLSMLAELREAGLPVVSFDAVVGDGLLRRIGRRPPFVVKVGSHHGGYGKARVAEAEDWEELADLLFSAEDYATTEPWLPHQRDLRVLCIGDRSWAMERRGRGWRANVDTIKARPIDVPPVLEELCRRAMAQLGAEVLALDILEQEDGHLVVIESNETPGLSGFPEDCWRAMADLLLSRLGV